ncbi:MAG: hypothetical protein JNL72_02545 [Flavipsychrobacter sp.]|nr:hypothetical protein [Flavipsychrobacter sp.]
MKFNEFQIYQNKVLGAHILWEFSKAFYLNRANDKPVSEEELYPSIFYLLPVLPLCLNSRVVEGIRSRNLREGSIIRALDESKDLFSGLQARMENLADVTLESIYVAHVSTLVIFDREKMIVIPNLSSLPNRVEKKLHKDYKDMLAASRRLGYWFSKLSMSEILMYFNISF